MLDAVKLECYYNYRQPRVDESRERRCGLYAEVIKAARRAAGMTQEEFGAVLGVTKQSVFLWENGKNKPNDEQRYALHEKFGIDYSVFYAH